jgi:membrane protease YdiL (CAAX protease family)
MFWLYRSKDLPLINPLKMHPLSAFIAGVKMEAISFLLLLIKGDLWKEMLLTLDSIGSAHEVCASLVKEQELSQLLQLADKEWQLMGIIFFVVIWAPITEEIIFAIFSIASLHQGCPLAKRCC